MQELKVKARIRLFFSLFFLIYFFLYVFPFPLSNLPLVGITFKYYYNAIDFFAIWLGEQILGFNEITKIDFTGSGDTTLNYVRVTFYVVCSLLISLCLTFVRLDIDYKRSKQFVRTYIRYFLAFMLLVYGFSKFFEGQFAYPSLERLDQKIGDSSPMGLLWTFMGYSKMYTVFGGLCQFFTGILLFFRRTSVIGSLSAFAVMINIVVLNFSYDVPVKLFSTHLLLIALYLLHPNLNGLFKLFFMKGQVALVYDEPLFANKIFTYVVLSFKFFVLFLMLLIVPVVGVQKTLNRVRENNWNGVYQTETFIIDEDVPESEDLKWKKWIINNDYATIFYNNSYEDYNINVDTISKKINFISVKDTLQVFDLRYDVTSHVMRLEGSFNRNEIDAVFKIKRKSDFELVKREFNWISEYPYNR